MTVGATTVVLSAGGGVKAGVSMVVVLVLVGDSTGMRVVVVDSLRARKLVLLPYIFDPAVARRFLFCLCERFRKLTKCGRQ